MMASKATSYVQMIFLGTFACAGASHLVLLVALFARAGVAELADAHGSGPCELRLMEVQVLSPAPSFLSFLLHRVWLVASCRLACVRLVACMRLWGALFRLRLRAQAPACGRSMRLLPLERVHVEAHAFGRPDEAELTKHGGERRVVHGDAVQRFDLRFGASALRAEPLELPLDMGDDGGD